MIDITKLIYGKETLGDSLRYAGQIHRRPIVVWNCTRTCNLNCLHCYSDSSAEKYPDELTTEEAKETIADLAEFEVPVLLFSGGEPLLRPDLFELIEFSVRLKIRTVISTNGTLMDKKMAKKIKEGGVAYVGISLDGIGEVNDHFRGRSGAFAAAIAGFRHCLEIGQRVGLRLTLTKYNYRDLPQIFAFIAEEKIPRACFYHLVYCGRGSEMVADDLSHQETRSTIDEIIEHTGKLKETDILTVDNHTDGVYIYQRLRKENSKRAKEALKLLKINGGNSSGIGIAGIDNVGNVHADQFWVNHSFGNVSQRKFGEIWMDTSDPLMAGLKDRKKLLKGKCAICHYQDICNGNFRVRAEVVYKNPWAEDPACYLTKEEITS